MDASKVKSKGKSMRGAQTKGKGKIRRAYLRLKLPPPAQSTSGMSSPSKRRARQNTPSGVSTAGKLPRHRRVVAEVPDMDRAEAMAAETSQEIFGGEVQRLRAEFGEFSLLCSELALSHQSQQATRQHHQSVKYNQLPAF